MTIRLDAITNSGARLSENITDAAKRRTKGVLAGTVTRAKLEAQLAAAKGKIDKSSVKLAISLFEDRKSDRVSEADLLAAAASLTTATAKLDANKDGFETQAENDNGSKLEKAMYADAQHADGAHRYSDDVKAALNPVEAWATKLIAEKKLYAGDPIHIDGAEQIKKGTAAFNKLPGNIRTSYSSFVGSGRPDGFTDTEVAKVKISDALSIYAVNGIVSDTGNETHFFTLAGHPIIGIYMGQGEETNPKGFDFIDI